MISEHLAEFMDHNTQLIVSNAIIDVYREKCNTTAHFRSEYEINTINKHSQYINVI